MTLLKVTVNKVAPIEYARLATMFKLSDASYAQRCYANIPLAERLQCDRIREVLLLGVSMCEACLGTTEEIHTFVAQRVKSIQAELSLFIPNILEIDELQELPDLSGLERMMGMKTTFPLMMARILEENRARARESTTTTTTTTMGHQVIALPLRSAPHKPNPSPPSPLPTMTPPPSPTPLRRPRPPPLTFLSLWQELQHALSTIHATFDATNPHTTDIVSTLQAAMQKASFPEAGVTPEEIWEDVLAEVGYLGRGYGGDEVDDGEVGDEEVVMGEGREGEDEDEDPVGDAHAIAMKLLRNLAAEKEKDAAPAVEAPLSTAPVADSSHEFSPVTHAGVPMADAPAIMRRFYRQTVERTLEEVLGVLGEGKETEVLQQYWEHVVGEVPVGDEEGEEEMEEEMEEG